MMRNTYSLVTPVCCCQSRPALPQPNLPLDGKIALVSKDLNGPNGLAFSPDEKYFYLTNWDERKKIVMRYDVQGDGTLSNGQVFCDSSRAVNTE